MTPLKPIENTTRVRGVPSKRYPPNTVCAHPECSEPVASIHHIFGRPPGPDSDSWFVAVVVEDTGVESETKAEGRLVREKITPHAIGLCGSGTTGHHGDVEEHRAWIKLEDGEFIWYERRVGTFGGPDATTLAALPDYDFDSFWRYVGSLNPQPGSREGKPKRRRAKSDSVKLRSVWSVKVPKDEQEDGHGVLEQGFEDAARIVGAEGSDTTRSRYYILADIFEFVRQHDHLDDRGRD